MQVEIAESKAAKAEARAESLRKERNSFMTQVPRTPGHTSARRCFQLHCRYLF